MSNIKYLVVADFDEFLVTFNKTESLLEFVNKHDDGKVNAFRFKNAYFFEKFGQNFSLVPASAGDQISSLIFFFRNLFFISSESQSHHSNFTAKTRATNSSIQIKIHCECTEDNLYAKSLHHESNQTHGNLQSQSESWTVVSLSQNMSKRFREYLQQIDRLL